MSKQSDLSSKQKQPSQCLVCKKPASEEVCENCQRLKDHTWSKHAAFPPKPVGTDVHCKFVWYLGYHSVLSGQTPPSSSSSSDGATAMGVEAPGSRTRLKFKDFYGDLEDDDDKAKEPIATSKSSASHTTSREVDSGIHINLNEDKKKLEEETKKTSGDHKLKWGKCSHCQKEGYPLECSRCHLSSYCNQQCQKNDYQLHKVICRRKDTFDKFHAKIPEVIKTSLAKNMGITDVSFLLPDLPTESEYRFGHRNVVMAEIIGPYYHFLHHGIVIKDMAGQQTHILFYVESKEYLHRVSEKQSRPYPLAECLTPGNFILLVDTCWHHFFDMTIGIRINHLNEDMAGQQTHILFYVESKEYLHRVSEKQSRPYPLAECLTPGNFILLVDTCWHHFFDMTIGIRINHLNEVQFIFQK